jgi:hypothetical protein
LPADKQDVSDAWVAFRGSFPESSFKDSGPTVQPSTASAISFILCLEELSDTRGSIGILSAVVNVKFNLDIPQAGQ